MFLECWRDAAEYDPLRASVRTWFLVRARSRALDNMRRARRSVMLPSDSALFEGMAAGTDDSSAEHEHATLDRLLRQLSSDQRAVVELVYFAGYSCGEIARTLGIPIGTVKSRTLRALERLRRLLESRECTQGSLP